MPALLCGPVCGKTGPMLSLPHDAIRSTASSLYTENRLLLGSFRLLIKILFGLLILFTFLLFLTLAFIFLAAFVSHNVYILPILNRLVGEPLD